MRNLIEIILSQKNCVSKLNADDRIIEMDHDCTHNHKYIFDDNTAKSMLILK
jgi:hypothetical protein